MPDAFAVAFGKAMVLLARFPKDEQQVSLGSLFSYEPEPEDPRLVAPEPMAARSTARGLANTVGRILRVGLTVSAFFFFYLGGILLSWLVLPLARLGGRGRMATTLRCQDTVQKSFVLFHDYMRVTRLVDFNPRHVAKNLPEGPFVIVANHPTLVDVTAIIAAVDRLCCVVKAPLFNSPLVGPLLRSCWHIKNGRGAAGDAAVVIGQAVERLAAGIPVLIFPEGTRSPPQGLRHFHRGSIEIATRAKVPIVPAVVQCVPPFLNKVRPWYYAPVTVPRYTVRLLPPVDPASWPANRHEATKKLERIFQKQLGLAEPSPGRGPSVRKPVPHSTPFRQDHSTSGGCRHG